MGFQRYAIENLRDEPEAVAPPLIEDTDHIQVLDGAELYFAGVSQGIGSSSDIHGMDVLVLSELPTNQACDLGRFTCAYTVLVRRLTDAEVEADSLARQGIARSCVELLWPLPDQVAGVVSFMRTGKTTNYTAVV